MEKVWNWIKKIFTWNAGVLIMALGITIITAAGIWGVWTCMDAVGPTKLMLTGMIVGAYGVFIMFLDLSGE